MSTHPESTANTGETKFEIPKTCKAGVVVNEGPNFHVEIQDVPVPEPGRKDQPLDQFVSTRPLTPAQYTFLPLRSTHKKGPKKKKN